MVTTQQDRLTNQDTPLQPSKLLGKTSQLKDLLYLIREKLSPILPDGKEVLSNTKTSASRLERELDDLIEIADYLKEEINL